MQGSPNPVYAIELDRLTKDYGPVRALDAVTAKFAKGRVGLLGPNGAGKTTLLKCLLGLLKPTAGRGAVLGIGVEENPLAVRQRVGYVPETQGYISGLTAAEFVIYAGELSGMPPREARKRAHEVLDYVGLGEERYRLVDTFSTGMKQKVKLAQAVVHDPELLLLDEPTNGLDPEGRERMLALVKDLGTAHGLGIIYSSHLLGDVEEVCQQVVILRQGRVAAQGSIEALRRSEAGLFEVRLKGETSAFLQEISAAGGRWQEKGPGHYRLDFGESERAPSRLVFEAAWRTRAQVRSFRPVRSTLEDVFIETIEEVAAAPGEGKS